MGARERRRAELRDRLVEGLIERGCARDSRVLSAFREVPRSLFLPGRSLEEVYADESVVTKRRRDGLPLSSSTEPCLMARMLDQLRVGAAHDVLEIGAGSGYNAALLAWLAGSDGTVVSVDLDGDTAARARRNLDRAGFDDVSVVHGDGWFAAPDHGPFDRIEMTVGAWDLSPHWLRALRVGGILVVPLWLRGGLQVSVAFTHERDGLRSVDVRPCGFMRLRGEHAGPECYAAFHGWTASLDSDSLAGPIQSLTAAPPRAVSVPELADHPPGWFARFLLDVPGAVSVVKEEDKSPSVALLSTSGASLAVLDGDRVLSFGDDDAMEALVDGALRSRPLAVEALEVRVTPTTRERDDKTRWSFTRPYHHFVASERAIDA